MAKPKTKAKQSHSNRTAPTMLHPDQTTSHSDEATARDHTTSHPNQTATPDQTMPRLNVGDAIFRATFLVAWTFLCIVCGQLLISVIFNSISPDLLDQPVWSTVYSALAYSFALFCIACLPHRFPQRWLLFTLLLALFILIYYIILFIIFINSADFTGDLFSIIVQGIAAFWQNLTFMGQLILVVALLTILMRIFGRAKFMRISGLSSHSSAPSLRTQLGLKGLPTWTDLGLAPIGYVVSLIAGALLALIFSGFSWFDISQPQDVGFNEIYSGIDRLVAFIAIVIIAPIAEEIIFRGWLYGRLRTFLGIPAALLITSVFFGLMHGQWNVGVTVFAMSIVLCLAREFTGTIYSGIIMHMLKNGIAFVLLYIVNIV